jgi:hypothetical protein
MKQTLLPHWANKLLVSCPKSGNGVHNWLFVTALKMHSYCSDKDELVRLLHEATTNCGREVPENEIEDAVRNSAPDRVGQPHAGPRWPARNAGLIESIVRNGPNFEQLEHLSPFKWSDNARHTEEIIDALFPGNPMTSLYFSMLVDNDSHDWRNSHFRLNGKVQGHNAKLHVHHFFPKSLLLCN